MINLDITVLFQLVNFLITLVLLNYFIIGPIRKVMAERKALMENMQGDADGTRMEARLKLETYEGRLAHMRTQIAAMRMEMKDTAQHEAHGRLETAGEQVRAMRQEATATLKAEAAGVEKTLEGRVDTFATKALEKILQA